MKVPELPEKPVDGFTIEWWSFEPCSSWSPGLQRHLAIYIENSTWAEFVAREDVKAFHSYSGKDRGAPFIDDWIHVNQSGEDMRFDGRSEGWDWPLRSHGTMGGVKDAAARWADAYATPREAAEGFNAHVAQWIVRKEEELVEARAAIENVKKLTAPYARFPIGTEVRLRRSVKGVPPGAWKATAKVIAYVWKNAGGLTLDGRLGGMQHWNVDDVEPVT